MTDAALAPPPAPPPPPIEAAPAPGPTRAAPGSKPTSPLGQRIDRPVPTRRLALGAALVGVAAVVSPAPLALLVFGNLLLAVVAVVDALLAPSPSRVGVERHLPHAIGLGAEGSLAWSITNPIGRAIEVRLADELAPSLGAGLRRFVQRVPAFGTIDRTTVLRPTRRGRFVPSEVVVRVTGPLGLGARQRARRLPGELRVQPAFTSRAEAELRIDRARILDIGIRSAKGLGGGTEFEQLREWTPDDDTRRMDWAASARAAKPIVRTYRAERNQTVLTLLDTGRTMAGSVGGVPRVEHAMDAVMLLTYLATRLGDRAGLVAFGSRTRAVVNPSHRGDQVGRVTEALFELEPELAESDYRSAFADSLSRFRRRALLVILTDLNTQAVGETLLPALPLIVRNHLVVVGAVRDPQLVAWATDVPADATAVYRQAAAQAELAARAKLTVQLRGLGAIVVDAAPGRLAPELGDAYLNAKSRGRL